MSDRTDPAWDEYLSTGDDPTGGELDGNEENVIEDESCLCCDNAEKDWSIRSRITPAKITGLREDEVFVFGSNLLGEHIGGAARYAYDHFDAEWGVGQGFTGHCYAIPTMNVDKKLLKAHVELFTALAEFNGGLFFYVTPIGCGFSGWSPKEIAPMFKKAAKLQNVALPRKFWNVLGIHLDEPGFEADYVCVDVETANEYMSSICSIGLVWVKGKKIVHKYYSLVNPEPGYYNWHNQQVHGLGPKDTCNAPVFSKVWEEVAPLIGDLPLVAHNARFDKNCLKEAFKVYQMDWPDYTFYDTLKGSRDCFGGSLPNHKLDTVAQACGYDLRNHHHALADAEACAYIAMTVWEWN